MMNTEDALTRAGLGFILGRISHLETVHSKSQVELDELATLETIRNRYFCKMGRQTPIQQQDARAGNSPNFFAAACPALYSFATASPYPPQLVRCPGAPLPVASAPSPNPDDDLPLAIARIVCISAPAAKRCPRPPAFSPDAVVVEPAATTLLPRMSQQAYPVNSHVLIKKDGLRGFVKDAYQLEDGTWLYHINVIIRSHDRVLARAPSSGKLVPAGSWRLTCRGDELGPPVRGWQTPSAHGMWWITYASDILANPDLREFFCYWPSPESGWPAGSFVSVPMGESGRQCARVLKHGSNDGYSTVVFPVLSLDDGNAGIRGKVLTSDLLGPSIYWARELYLWSPATIATKPSSSSGSRKRCRSFDVNPPSSPSEEYLPPMKLTAASSSTSSSFEGSDGLSFLRSEEWG